MAPINRNKAMAWTYSILVALSVIGTVNSYGSGAPSSACTTMVPGHPNTTPQSGTPPFTIGVSKTTYTNPGETIVVTITATGNAIRGFLIQARRADPNLDTSVAVGTFTQIANSQGLACASTTNSALTHTDSNNAFTTITVTWTAPATVPGHIKFQATLATSMNTYWVGVTSDQVSDTNSPAIVTTTTTAAPVSTDNTLIDTTGCGSTKGCIRTPANCASASCDILFTWSPDSDSNYLNFEMQRKGSGWVGLGLSNDNLMGDDSVMECLRDDSSGTMSVSQSKNVGRSNTEISAPKDQGIDTIKVGYDSGSQVCRFRRLKTVSGRTSDIFDLTNSYYIIMAYGNAFTSGSSIEITKHSAAPVVSDSKQDFSQLTDNGASAKIPINVKAHGCLMIIAWTMTAAFGMTIARHFKKQWPGAQLCSKDSWFPLHAGSMILTVLFTIIAFIIIFVHVGGYSQVTGANILKAHPVLGIIVTILAVINPLMALCRPAPDSSKRPIFNWAHWGVGTAARVIGVIAIFLGVSFPTVKDAGQASSLLYIMIGYVCFYAVIEIVLEIYKCAKGSSEHKSSTMELKAPGDASAGSGMPSESSSSPDEESPIAVPDTRKILHNRPLYKTFTNTRVKQGQLFRNILLGILILGLVGFGLALIIIIAIS